MLMNGKSCLIPLLMDKFLSSFPEDLRICVDFSQYSTTYELHFEKANNVVYSTAVIPSLIRAFIVHLLDWVDPKLI